MRHETTPQIGSGAHGRVGLIISHFTMPRSHRHGYRPVYGPAFRNAAFHSVANQIRQKIRNRIASGRTQTASRRRGVSSGQGITSQYDRSLIYRKKRMSGKKKRRWKKFARKVHAVAEKDLGSRSWITNGVKNIAAANPVTSVQQFGEIALYPCRGVTTVDEDLTTLMTEDTSIPTAGKVIFQSAVLDLTIVNRSTVEGGAGVPIEMDIYLMTAKKSFQSNNVGRDLHAAFVDGLADTAAIGGTNKITVDKRGSTPFEYTQALSKYGMKIWKKTKYTISAGSSITYQLRDPKRHVYDKAYIIDNDQTANIKGTKFLWFVCRLQPGYLAGAGTALDVDIGYTKKYMYKVDEANGDESRMD